MKMRGVNDIWLRTMGEDEGNVQCLAGWLRLFVGSNEPKKYEGIVAPAIWVGLAFPFFFLQSHTLRTLRSLSDTLSIPIRDIVLHALSPRELCLTFRERRHLWMIIQAVIRSAADLLHSRIQLWSRCSSAWSGRVRCTEQRTNILFYTLVTIRWDAIMPMQFIN